jgi:hypothetical protein
MEEMEHFISVTVFLCHFLTESDQFAVADSEPSSYVDSESFDRSMLRRERYFKRFATRRFLAEL